MTHPITLIEIIMICCYAIQFEEFNKKCYTQSDVLFTFLENIHKEDHNLHFPRNKTNKRHANRTKLQRQQECRIVISFIMNCKTLYLPVQIEFLEQ